MCQGAEYRVQSDPLMMLVRECRLKEGQRPLPPPAASVCTKWRLRVQAGDDEARHFLVERRSRRSQRPGWSHEVDITTGTRFILPVRSSSCFGTHYNRRKKEDSTGRYRVFLVITPSGPVVQATCTCARYCRSRGVHLVGLDVSPIVLLVQSASSSTCSTLSTISATNATHTPGT